MSKKTGDSKTKANKTVLSEKELRFIEDYASLILVRGMPYASGCVLGFLLLRQRPVTIDEIAEALGLSRAGTWNAARKLETFGHVQRQGVAGSKKALYSPSESLGTPLLAQMILLGDLAALMDDCAKNILKGEAAARLASRVRYYNELRDTMVAKIRELDAERGGSRDNPPATKK